MQRLPIPADVVKICVSTEKGHGGKKDQMWSNQAKEICNRTAILVVKICFKERRSSQQLSPLYWFCQVG